MGERDCEGELRERDRGLIMLGDLGVAAPSGITPKAKGRSMSRSANEGFESLEENRDDASNDGT